MYVSLFVHLSLCPPAQAQSFALKHVFIKFILQRPFGRLKQHHPRPGL